MCRATLTATLGIIGASATVFLPPNESTACSARFGWDGCYQTDHSTSFSLESLFRQDLQVQSQDTQSSVRAIEGALGKQESTSESTDGNDEERRRNAKLATGHHRIILFDIAVRNLVCGRSNLTSRKWKMTR